MDTAHGDVEAWRGHNLVGFCVASVSTVLSPKWTTLITEDSPWRTTEITTVHHGDHSGDSAILWMGTMEADLPIAGHARAYSSRHPSRAQRRVLGHIVPPAGQPPLFELFSRPATPADFQFYRVFRHRQFFVGIKQQRFNSQRPRTCFELAPWSRKRVWSSRMLHISNKIGD